MSGRFCKQRCTSHGATISSHCKLHLHYDRPRLRANWVPALPDGVCIGLVWEEIAVC